VDEQKAAVVVLVSAKPIAGRIWKSLTQDECIETCNLCRINVLHRKLRGSLVATNIHINS